jgi:hypothetical protein
LNNRALLLVLSIACVLAALPAVASAACPQAGCPGGGEPVTGTTSIQVNRVALGGSPGAVAGGSVVDNQNPRQIDCGATCVGSWEWSCDDVDCTFTSVGLTAATAGGWAFDHWSGCDSAVGATCTQEAFGDDGATRAVSAFFVDVQDPVVSLTGQPPASPRNSGFTLNASNSDNDRVASAVWYRRPAGGVNVTDAVVSNPGANISRNFDVSGLADGTYVFGVRVTDHVGRQAAAERTVVVDKSLNAPAFTAPAAGAWVNSTTVPITWGAIDADVTDANVTCKLDTGGFAPCDARTSTTPTGLSQGPHTATVRLLDAAGNTAETSRAFKVDSLAPTGAFTNSSSPFTFTLDGTGSQASATCSVDGGTASDCSGGSFAVDGAAPGAHALTVRITDEAGNTAELSKGFVIESPPTGGSGTPDPGTGTPDPGTGTPGTGTPDPGTGTPAPGTGTPTIQSAPTAAATCVVPKLVGLTLAKAKKALKNRRCALGRVKRKAAKRSKRGKVLAQSLKAGKKLKAGTKVGLTVGR